MYAAIEATPNLDCMEGGAEDLLVGGREGGGAGRQWVEGVLTGGGQRVRARAVIITTGTFLRAIMHIGPTHKVVGGRYGEASSTGLSKTFERLAFQLSRLTTATPPRLDGATIDYSKTTVQRYVAEPIQTTIYASWTAADASAF